MGSQKIGFEGEQTAVDYLLTHGIEILQRNFHSRYGEIDIIGLDKNNQTLIFYEVKAYEKNNWVSPYEMVHFGKQKKIIATAKYFLCRHPAFEYDIRFDVIVVLGRRIDAHIEDAFRLN